LVGRTGCAGGVTVGESRAKWGRVGAAGGLMGEFRHTIDDKGRLTLPARIRDELGAVFVANKGLDGCLFLYPQAEWDALESKLQALPLSQKDARAVARHFFSGATECHCDSQGRVLLPANLRSFAGLEHEGVVIGVGSRVEVWSPSLWERYLHETDETIGDIAERLQGLGL